MMGWMAPLRHRRAKLVFLENHQEREPSMSEITTIGLDLAKHVLPLAATTARLPKSLDQSAYTAEQRA